MRTIRLSAALASCLMLFCAAAAADDTLQGMKIMPKSNQLRLQSGNTLTGDVYKIAWPAVVVRTRGRWLWIEDDGGYSKPAVGGWVYTDDILTMDRAGAHYTEQLRNGDQAWLYWLRGIYWEDQGKFGVAQGDYLDAERLAGLDKVQTPGAVGSPLDDVEIRLGRLAARQQYDNGQGKLVTAKRSEWEQYFCRARNLNADRPQLYMDWGDALSEACSCGQNSPASPNQSAPAATASGKLTAESIPTPATNSTAKNSSAAPAGNSSTTPNTECNCLPSQSQSPPALATAVASKAPDLADGFEKEALGQYEVAGYYSTHWWRVPYAEAELLLGRCDKPSKADERMERVEKYATTPRLQKAEELFNQSIRWNANVSEAYADLGETMRLRSEIDRQAVAANPNAGIPPTELARLEGARESATTACAMSNYRDYRSLRTLAQIYADLGDYSQALNYAERALEAAVEENDIQRLNNLWAIYDRRALDAGLNNSIDRQNLFAQEHVADIKRWPSIIAPKESATNALASNDKNNPRGLPKGPGGQPESQPAAAPEPTLLMPPDFYWRTRGH